MDCTVDDHNVVLVEPGNKYLTQLSLKFAEGKAVAQTFYVSLAEHKLAILQLYVAGCGGCHVNTGPNNEVIHHLKILLARPLDSAMVSSTAELLN